MTGVEVMPKFGTKLSTARLNLRAAELAVATANAERERVSIGSAYVLAQERPERIDVSAAKDVLDRANEKLETYRDLVAKGVLARESLLDVETAAINAQKSYDQSLFDQRMSTQGSPERRKIAQNAVEQAETLLRQRQEELKGYRVTSPDDGIIQRVLIRPGEFNQDTGKPGLIVCSGLWFDAHLDQRALAIPRDALTSLSAGKGIVRQIDEQGTQKAVEVRIGEVDDRFVEVIDGLDASALLVRGNQRFLRDGDRVQARAAFLQVQHENLTSVFERVPAQQRDAQQQHERLSGWC